MDLSMFLPLIFLMINNFADIYAQSHLKLNVNVRGSDWSFVKSLMYGVEKLPTICIFHVADILKINVKETYLKF